MTDPALAGRLATLEIPTLVLWGDSDKIVDADYGYFAGDTMLIPDFGEIPQRLGHISLALLPTNGLHIRPANNMQVVMNVQQVSGWLAW